MATGRERRAEKLNERLRGAQRANVGDESFHIDIAGLASVPPPEPSPVRQEPNTSAKRRKLDNSALPAAVATSQAQTRVSPRSRRSAAQSPYDLPDTSKESVAQVVEPQASRRSLQNGTRASVRSIRRSPLVSPQQEEGEDDLETLPEPVPFRSPMRRPASASFEEVEESPAGKPGSGQRRVVMSSPGLPSSARRNDSVLGDDAPPSSSPLARKVRRMSDAASVRSARTARLSSRLADVDEVDELSSDRVDERPAQETSDEVVEELEQVSDPAETDEEPVIEDEPEEAEEIDEIEAARALGKERRRRSPRKTSPELGMADAEDLEEEEAEEEEPAPKKRRGRQPRSPAVQRQSAAPKAKSKAPKETRRKSKAAEPKTAPKTRRTSGADDGPSIEITVQRFVNVKQQILEEAGEDDPLQSTVPFANSGETVVDVLAQVCTEVIDSTLVQFETLLGNTEDKAKKKEYRIKMRALEAYREELNASLLQHAIYLNDWQTLRKRVRHVQREKLALRDDILRLKAEREQVALQMDAIRSKHEEDTKESNSRLNASSLMHDIDLVIDQARTAPQSSRAEAKQAELANLEVLISRISEEASSSSAAGGILSQVRDFNAFLERAAVALESR